MSWLMIALLLIASYLILVPLLTHLSAKRLIGQRAPGEAEERNRLLYFYSQGCAPCRGMTPAVDQLAESHGEVHKIDVRSDPETARRYKIRATPTIVLIKNGVIDEVALGAKTPAQLETLLKKIA